MADTSKEILSKSKNHRSYNKEKHRESKHNSHHKNNDIENDRKHGFKNNHKKDSPYKDDKHKSDMKDRKSEDRKAHFTQAQDDRYVSYRIKERNDHSSVPFYRQKTLESNLEGFRNFPSNNEWYLNQSVGISHGHFSLNEDGHNYNRTNNERFVSFNRSTSNNDECVGSLWQKIDYLSNQVDVLTQENDRLKYNSNVRQNEHNRVHADVTISFRNKDLEERFLPILTQLATDLIEGNITVDDLRDFKCSKSNSLDGGECMNDVPEGELFQLDNSATEPNENPHVPKYETSFTEILEDEEEKIKMNTKSERPKFQKVCFNCGEDHIISKCPHKINYYKVAMAKKQRALQRPPTSGRYHLNKEQDETVFKPGILSPELREALGLKTDQIPLYVYRMRLLNYPPGWLEEAMVESSGIAVYDSSGSVLNNKNDEHFESTMNRSEIRYDPAKYIDYPGFNVPLPPDCIDEGYKFGFPPMQEHQMRSYVEECMPKADIRPNRKRKLQLPIDTSKIQQIDEDMDLDESLGETIFQFAPPLPKDAPPPPPPDDFPPPPPPDVAPPPLPLEDVSEFPPEPPSENTMRIVLSHDSDSGTNTPMSDSIMEALEPVVKRFKMDNLDSTDAHNSPSLKELEEMKKQLVMELGNVSECPSPSVQDGSQTNTSDVDDLNPNSDSRGSFPYQDNSNDLSSFSDCSFSSSPAEIRQSAGTLRRSESVCSKSKQMTLGTPSLSRHSSFQKLPDYDKFAQNVTSHINFENLPNSTGTYEKMKKVLKKVKEKFNALMQ